MKIEKLDRVVMHVENLDKAKKLFSDVLGITFEDIPIEGVEPREVKPGPRAAALAARRPQGATQAVRVAISPSGLELVETDVKTEMPAGKEGIRTMHFKVADYEQAKAELAKKGITLLTEITLGGLKEAIYDENQLFGARMGLVAYDEPTPMKAIKKRGKRA